MIRPMLASLTEAPLDDPEFVYEPKYDGIRAIAEVPAESGRVRLWSRLGNEKTDQFPEIAVALERWARRLKAPVVLDGEIVALDEQGDPTGFQNLQGRIHIGGRESFFGPNAPKRSKAKGVRAGEAAFIAFDLLHEGRTDWRDRPLVERRAGLERVFGRTGSPILRISDIARGDGRPLYRQALASGWEGLIAKRADSIYKSGKRTPDWRKLKIVQEQEFVIGGWTEPRQTRSYFGALLLGVYAERARDLARPEGSQMQVTREHHGARASARGGGAPRDLALTYVGHTGTGFNERELARLMTLLRPLETTECVFRDRPRTNERPHWVKPVLVAQVKFTEWTADGKLRHPVYVGLRDDKKPREVRREPTGRLHATSSSRLALPLIPARNRLELASSAGARNAGGGVPRARARAGGVARATPKGSQVEVVRERVGASASESGGGAPRELEDQLLALEESRRDGVIVLPDGDRLSVSNLHKIFWPKQKLTKGDLFRYYVQVAPVILPAVADRPLVMKRYPNGVTGQPFYQHRVTSVPEGVRVATVKVAQTHISGGNLKTLLYMTQLAAISQDPWFSRVQAPAFPDHAALDLDPMPGVPFRRVLDVARWIRDELQRLGTIGVPKTSGAEGLHVYIPLPPKTPFEAGLLICQIVATVVAHKHPKVATVERSVAARGARVYVDYLQNILGKTLATAYSARASDYAGVSTPLSWEEVDGDVHREDFTIRSIPARVRTVGDLWAVLRTAPGLDLSKVSVYAERAGRGRLRGDKR